MLCVKHYASSFLADADDMPVSFLQYFKESFLYINIVTFDTRKAMSYMLYSTNVVVYKVVLAFLMFKRSFFISFQIPVNKTITKCFNKRVLFRFAQINAYSCFTCALNVLTDIDGLIY